jgi:hypothetical protein
MEENNDKKIDLKDRILRDIQAGKVSMRPKLYFSLKIAALVMVAFAVVCISIFILNFILFSLRIGSQAMLLGFGPRGFLLFLSFFPWGLLLIDLVLLIVLESLLRRFQFGYRTPTLYLLLGLLALTFSVGFALDKGTGFNDEMLTRARDRHLPPPVGGFYQGAVPPSSKGLCRRCVITDINGSEIFVTDSRTGSTTIRVILPPNDPRATTSELKIGDRVFIAGDEDDGVIRAFGLRKMEFDEGHRPMFFFFRKN